MITIRQHGSDGQLFDISSFLADVDAFERPDTWVVTVAECLGDRSEEIEEITSSGLTISDSEFRLLYCGIYQTIDGRFIGLASGQRLFDLFAVDSSYWEVSGSPALESHMLATYGAYSRA